MIISLLLFFGWAALTWKYPKWMTVALTAMFPLYLVRFTFLGMPFTFAEWCVYASFFGFLVSHAEKWWKNLKNWNAEKCFKHEYFPLVLFFLVAVVSAIIVPSRVNLGDGGVVESRMIAFGILKGFILTGILYFVLFRTYLMESTWVKRALYAFGFSAVLVSLWGLWQVVSGAYVTPDMRASGPYASANYLSLFISPAILFFLCSLWNRFLQKRFLKEELPYYIFEIVSSVVLLGALYFSKSFGAFIGIFFALVFFFILQKRFFTRKVLMIGGFVVVVLGIFFASQLRTEKFQQLFQDRSSWSVRKEVWTVATGLLRSHPILGIGLGQFESQYKIHAPEILGHAPTEWVMLHSHNLYLMFWLSMGFSGFLLFLWVVEDGFWSLKKWRSVQYIQVIGATMLVYVLVHGILDVPFWKNDLALQFWMVLAVLKSGVSFSGVVEKGESRGKKMGFPTLNLKLDSPLSLDFGVYGCFVRVEEKLYNGVMHFGPRPTFEEVKPMCEVHLFDASGDFYGKRVDVEVLEKIRGVVKFSSIDSLQAQLHNDVQFARTHFFS